MKFQRSRLPLFSKVGGDDRSRTCDFLNANQALCQLSYIPVTNSKFQISDSKFNMISNLESGIWKFGIFKLGCGDRIWTCDLRVMSPTSYRTAPPRAKVCQWWAWVDSNYRPHAYQACALTNWATGPQVVQKLDRSLKLNLKLTAANQKNKNILICWLSEN